MANTGRQNVIFASEFTAEVGDLVRQAQNTAAQSTDDAINRKDEKTRNHTSLATARVLFDETAEPWVVPMVPSTTVSDVQVAHSLARPNQTGVPNPSANATKPSEAPAVQSLPANPPAAASNFLILASRQGPSFFPDVTRSIIFPDDATRPIIQPDNPTLR